MVFFLPRLYTCDLPSPLTQEEVVEEAARALGVNLRTLATNNRTYTHLSKFSGLQQLSDLANSAAKKSIGHQEPGNTEGDPTKQSRRTEGGAKHHTR